MGSEFTHWPLARFPLSQTFFPQTSPAAAMSLAHRCLGAAVPSVSLPWWSSSSMLVALLAAVLCSQLCQAWCLAGMMPESHQANEPVLMASWTTAGLQTALCGLLLQRRCVSAKHGEDLITSQLFSGWGNVFFHLKSVKTVLVTAYLFSLFFLA